MQQLKCIHRLKEKNPKAPRKHKPIIHNENNITTTCAIDRSARVLQLSLTTLTHTTNFNTGNHFSSSTGRFTAPVAGNYIFGTTIRYDSFSGSYFYVSILKNGSIFYARELTSLTGSYLHASVHTIMNMAAGDYCNVTLRNAGDSDIQIDNDCNFYGYLLG